jgi:hypothetical protein
MPETFNAAQLKIFLANKTKWLLKLVGKTSLDWFHAEESGRLPAAVDPDSSTTWGNHETHP